MDWGTFDFHYLSLFFLDHRENILKTAKALVEDTKTNHIKFCGIKNPISFSACDIGISLKSTSKPMISASQPTKEANQQSPELDLRMDVDVNQRQLRYFCLLILLFLLRVCILLYY